MYFKIFHDIPTVRYSVLMKVLCIILDVRASSTKITHVAWVWLLTLLKIVSYNKKGAFAWRNTRVLGQRICNAFPLPDLVVFK